MPIAKKIKITGLVQGVGFRPFIYRIAHQHNVKGWVFNTNKDVVIHAQGLQQDVHHFIEKISANHPVAAVINQITQRKVKEEPVTNFKIKESNNISDEITIVSPDIAVCAACINDIKSQHNRVNYPLVNCTNCGPRFSIIKKIPYDRKSTSMANFKMCSHCKTEYTNILDRRFHAQPIACNSCGPGYQLSSDSETNFNFQEIIKQTSQYIDEGKIVAIKGVGGYHLACDAHNQNACHNLRNAKNRESKPFAVLFKDEVILEKYALYNAKELEVIRSWQGPITLLKYKGGLAKSVTNDFLTIGSLLPFMPFHYLLFEYLKTDAIVLTSGNISDEPIVTDDEKAKELFAGITEGVILYNREIVNRVDDSVVFVSNGQTRIIRRSRGYAPLPVITSLNTEGIFAAGAEFTNCFAIGKGKEVILSQHIGDLQNFETLEFYKESFARYSQLFKFKPKIAVCDKHPDYLSTQFAKELGVNLIEVQHHHAHIASVITEHNLKEKVIGIALDGTGLGDDNTIWGGEFLYADLYGYERMANLETIPLIGGDKAVKEPWRIALAMLLQTFGNDVNNYAAILKTVNKKDLNLATQVLDKRINVYYSSGAGRWFDGFAALLGLVTHSGFHAEAPMRLEHACQSFNSESYQFNETEKIISYKPVVEQILADKRKNIEIPIIAAKIHNTMAEICLQQAIEMRGVTACNTVALSGGVFQNKYLSEKLEFLLKKNNFDIFLNKQVPANDGGLVLGQLAIAAAQTNRI